MKNIAQTGVLCAALAGGASAFVGSPLSRSMTPALRTRLVSPKTGLAVLPPKSSSEALEHRGTEDFAVDFNGIQDTFYAQNGAKRGPGLQFGAAAGAGLAALGPLVLGAAEASAKGGEFGVIEGRTASFLHPIIMGTLFVVSVRAAILGFEWREQRTMSTRMSALKEQLPLLSTGARATTPLKGQADVIRQKIAELGEDAAEAAAGLTADLEKLTSSAATDVEVELANMTARRKELSSKNVRDRHYDVGALLLGLGTFAAIEGPVNTYLRAQKLFPGPHLYAGAGCVVAWAVAASLVPKMQKGSEVARIAHISINVIMIGTFAWQIFTGIPIAQKVWEFTKWP